MVHVNDKWFAIDNSKFSYLEQKLEKFSLDSNEMEKLMNYIGDPILKNNKPLYEKLANVNDYILHKNTNLENLVQQQDWKEFINNLY